MKSLGFKAEFVHLSLRVIVALEYSVNISLLFVLIFHSE
jgi:hypothetical protein